MEALAKEFDALGYEVDRSFAEQNIVVLKNFTIQVGSHAGKVIDLGIPGQDFPFSPPAGLHLRPSLAANGVNNINASPMGGDWQYWSRRLPVWTDRTAKHIISYVNKVFSDV